MLQRRGNAAASNYKEGLLVTGGAADGKVLTSTEIFHNGQWTWGHQLPIKLTRHCQVQYGGTVFIAGIPRIHNLKYSSLFFIGGSSGGLFDGVYSLEDNGWIRKTSLNSARANHACTVHGSNMYLVGGFVGRASKLILSCI